jgi:signal transduction histidine kinase
VPKFLVDDDGSIGERNDVNCVSIEHKMGIHSSPTCVMSYGDDGGAIGYLVGEENRGMRAMFTKDSPVELQPVDLNAVVADSLKLLHGEIITRGTAVEFDPRPSLPPVMASRVELQQVVINLVLNSLEALATRVPAEPVEPPRVRIRLFATADGICLEVADNGPGIPAANLASVFEPFFSTKSGANGLGLGLSISRGIVERCGGKLEAVPPQDGRGTVFRITLPASAGGRQALTCENIRGEVKLSPFPH